MSYINISGYQFKQLTNLDDLQKDLKKECKRLDIKGTILLSIEGINLFICANKESIEKFKEILSSHQFSIAWKESPSGSIPFDRMLVKIKKEIITMGYPSLKPDSNPAPYLSPQMFKQWIEDGKEMVILDTRNDYEVRLGKFKNAIDLNIKNFRSFPQGLTQLQGDKTQTVVTYCTGGIRCEKAALYLKDQGYANVYQLEGGILNYLEQCGNTHFEGECFVFDKRIAVDDKLKETQSVQCFVCRQPVSAKDQASPDYIAGESCPHCAKDSDTLSSYR